MRLSRRNIGHRARIFCCSYSDLVVFEHWTENPRVGGSIPPLATIQIKALVENDTYVKCPRLLDDPTQHHRPRSDEKRPTAIGQTLSFTLGLQSSRKRSFDMRK